MSCDAWGLNGFVPLIGVASFPALTNGGTAFGFWANQTDYANDLGDSDGTDFLVWQQQFGSSPASLGSLLAVPEPATHCLFLFLLVGISWSTHRKRFL